MNSPRDGTPLVAVTTLTLHDPGDARKNRVAVYGNYITALERMNLTPVLITPAHSSSARRRLVELCDGLVLTGGDDIDPARYGEEPRPEVEMVDRGRDEMEFEVLGHALARDLPVLGVCRGHQLLNVHFGGTLYQDIGAQLGLGSHEQTTDWSQHHHTVRVTEGTRIQTCMGIDHFEVNSFHHQAVKDVAPGLRVTASSEDGVVEALEADGHRWVMGVQWHPERREARAEEVDPNRCVFRAFGLAVGQHAAT